jgi:hypothetical protein
LSALQSTTPITTLRRRRRRFAFFFRFRGLTPS